MTGVAAVDVLLAEQNLPANMALLAGVALITTWLVMRVRKRRAAGEDRADLTPRELIERNRQHDALRGDLEDLMVEIEQLTRRFGAQLDAKSIHLEKLLDDAEQRIAELKGLADAATGASTAPPGNAEATRTPTDKAKAARAPRAAPDDEAPAVAPAAGDDASPDDPLADRVYQLADAGQDPVAIARHLNEHVGKVELILALRQT